MTADDAEADKPGSWEWAVCGASVTGWQHAQKGLGCDDAFAYGVIGDYVVVAVADGAGSVTGTSAWGSYAACQSVLLDAMDPEFIDDFRTGGAQHAEALMRWLFEGAVGRVANQADYFGLPVARLSTTLSVAVADPELAAFGQIGDGIVVAEDAESIRTVLTETKDEYANSTWFLQTNGAFDEAFQAAVLKNVGAFGLSTDGMSYKITNIATGDAYEPFFKGSWSHVRSGTNAGDFAALLRGIQDDQTGDDKTMVLAAMRWEDDTYHPSARPVSKIVVNSAPPAMLELPVAQEPLRSDELAVRAANGIAPQQPPDELEPILDLSSDAHKTDPVGREARESFGKRSQA